MLTLPAAGRAPVCGDSAAAAPAVISVPSATSPTPDDATVSPGPAHTGTAADEAAAAAPASWSSLLAAAEVEPQLLLTWSAGLLPLPTAAFAALLVCGASFKAMHDELLEEPLDELLDPTAAEISLAAPAVSADG